MHDVAVGYDPHLTPEEPRRADPWLLGMILFLMTEVMLYSGLISACLLTRHRDGVLWPPPENIRLPDWVTIANTGVLLLSGIVLFAARSRRTNVLFAAVLGTVFLAVQGFEWTRFVGFAVTEANGPYTGLFYGTIGMHGLHVLSGVIVLIYGLLRLAEPNGDRRMRVIALYWYLIVLVWPILYLLIYR